MHQSSPTINQKTIVLITLSISSLFSQHQLWGAASRYITSSAYIAEDTIRVSAPSKLPLITAARSGDLPLLVRLITAGADLYATNKDGDTALIIAASYGHENIIEALIMTTERHNLLLNAHDVHGYTALMHACTQLHKKSVEMLTLAGANLNIKNDDGLTALALAKKHTVMNDTSPRHDCCKREAEDIVAFLQDYGAV